MQLRAVAAAPAVDTSGHLLGNGEAHTASHLWPCPPSSFNPTVNELYGGRRVG